MSDKRKDDRRKSMMSLALPDSRQETELVRSVEFGSDAIEFKDEDVRIDYHGLSIRGETSSPIHQEDLYIVSELGRGACSVVKKAQRLQHVATRELYALKIFSIYDREKRLQLLKEIITLTGIDCPSLIGFHGAYLKDGSIHVVLEHMDRGSLTDVIHAWKDVSMDDNIMAAVAYQMLWGLAYLHFERRLHRDIKPQNVLINSRGEVKLSDFGIARELDGDTDLAQTMVGTVRYMSPERLAGKGYDSSADVWSMGIVLLEMATRQLPFRNAATQIDMHDYLEEMRVEDLLAQCGNASGELVEVLRGCLHYQPEDRLTAEEVLDLPWFSNAGIPDLDAAVEVVGEWVRAAGPQPDGGGGGTPSGGGNPGGSPPRRAGSSGIGLSARLEEEDDGSYYGGGGGGGGDRQRDYDLTATAGLGGSGDGGGGDGRRGGGDNNAPADELINTFCSDGSASGGSADSASDSEESGLGRDRRGSEGSGPGLGRRGSGKGGGSRSRK